MKDKNKFVPELHDIGKLVDGSVKTRLRRKTGKSWKSHVFVDFDFQNLGISQPTSPSWWGQYNHKTAEIEKDINQWNLQDRTGNTPSPESKYHLFLLILADHLASSVSRATLNLEKKPSQQEGILKLWNKNFFQNEKDKRKHWAAFRTVNDLKNLFDEIQNCQSGEEFLTKYKENLLLTPEDKNIPRDITSLHTHVELVGKIYRVLEKNTEVVKELDGTISVKYNRIRVKKINKAEGGTRTTGTNDVDKGKWQPTLVKCWIKFPHSFVRLRDVNLLKKRGKIVNNIVKNYKDEVLFTTSDFITLFLPVNQDLKEIFKPLLEWGFYIEIEKTIADLGILSSILDRKTLKARESNNSARLQVLNRRNTKIFKKVIMQNLPDEIEPPICDICQQEKAKERVKENIRELICEKCQEIRNMREPFREYGTTWEQEGIKVCWFKFSLDQKKLEDWLRDAFEKYINRYNFEKANVLKDEFRFLALRVDFYHDYKEMIKEFWKQFSGNEDIKKPIVEYDELGVFKYSPEITTKVIKRFLKLFDQSFPGCVSDKNSPINLSLSIANIKYPIRDHWRYFEQGNKSFLNIYYHNVFENFFAKSEVQEIFEKLINSNISQSYLYKLIQTQERLHSDMYLTTEIFNNRANNPEPYELFLQGITPLKFLNFCKIIKGVEINE